jgi:hypothetical protein
MLVIEVMAAKTITAIAARFKRRDGNATVKYRASLSVFLGVFNRLWIMSVDNFMAYRPSLYP